MTKECNYELNPILFHRFRLFVMTLGIFFYCKVYLRSSNFSNAFFLKSSSVNILSPSPSSSSNSSLSLFTFCVIDDDEYCEIRVYLVRLVFVYSP